MTPDAKQLDLEIATRQAETQATEQGEELEK